VKPTYAKYWLSDEVKEVEMGVHVERMGKTNAHRLLVGRILRKKLLGGIRRSWENNIKMCLKNRTGGVDRIHLAKCRMLIKAIGQP
jgi:hypothetical protein